MEGKSRATEEMPKPHEIFRPGQMALERIVEAIMALSAADVAMEAGGSGDMRILKGSLRRAEHPSFLPDQA